MWGLIKEIIETLYYLSGVGLFATVIIGIKQLGVLKKDLRDRNKRAAVEKSLEYLDFFASHFLPTYNAFQKKFKEEVPEPVDTTYLLDGNFNVQLNKLSNEEMAECIIKNKLSLADIYNQLEFFSSAMLNGVAEEELVYKPIGKIYVEFVEEEHLLLSILRNGGTPYVNIMELYGKWKNRQEVEKAELLKRSAELKISEIGDAHRAKPPIGF